MIKRPNKKVHLHGPLIDCPHDAKIKEEKMKKKMLTKMAKTAKIGNTDIIGWTTRSAILAAPKVAKKCPPKLIADLESLLGQYLPSLFGTFLFFHSKWPKYPKMLNGH
jgi:hypothetical protein